MGTLVCFGGSWTGYVCSLGQGVAEESCVFDLDTQGAFILVGSYVTKLQIFRF